MFRWLAAWLVVLGVVGCGSAASTDAGLLDGGGGLDASASDASSLDAGAPDAGLVDAGAQGAGAPDAGAPDAGSSDAGAADGGPVDSGCVGACATTTLSLSFGTAMAPLDRAQHGLEPDGGLYVEAHAGGDSACPSMSSPTPLRTVIISGLRVGGGVQTLDAGLRVTLLDFAGTLTTRPLERAVFARATPRFVAPGQLVSYTLEVTFDGGTLTGGFAAAHCPSLDGP